MLRLFLVLLIAFAVPVHLSLERGGHQGASLDHIYDGEHGGLKVVTMSVPEKCTRKSRFGDFLTIHWVGKLGLPPPGNTVFDNTHDGDGFRFRLGAGMVIQGKEFFFFPFLKFPVLNKFLIIHRV
jgi:hypothetical protein